ncbi:unnamed protein product [Fusarium equiseti]|uniref:Transmembrane protein n=1 Tax=Fusarium equiseti TaxID=61235 RepID=A0A8J2NC09_FUSEQ|nr:unnamed protein product [Fusarium equiseti]
MDVKTPRPGVSPMSFDIKDIKTQKFLLIQLFVIISFSFHTATLLYLPQLRNQFTLSHQPVISTTPAWVAQVNNTSTFPSTIPSTDTHDHASSAAMLCGDVWLALSLMAGTDAFWVVATFNHTLMKNWHYFISLRMMALASIISFCLYIPSNWGKSTLGYSFALFLSCTTYWLFNYTLSQLHRQPSNTTANAHFGSIQQYSDKMSRLSFGWGRALHVSVVICSVPGVLSMVMPSGWVTIIPLVSIPFESILLAKKKLGRSPEFILSGGVFIHAVCFTHWGLSQVSSSPRLTLPSWAFLAHILMSLGRILQVDSLDRHPSIVNRALASGVINPESDDASVPTYSLL